jgi:hypothetical protein
MPISRPRPGDTRAVGDPPAASRAAADDLAEGPPSGSVPERLDDLALRSARMAISEKAPASTDVPAISDAIRSISDAARTPNTAFDRGRTATLGRRWIRAEAATPAVAEDPPARSSDRDPMFPGSGLIPAARP